MDITFRPAAFPDDTAIVEALFTGFLHYLHEESPMGGRDGLRQKYPLDTVPAQVARFAELHAPPSGSIVLAVAGEAPVGMGMMRERAPGVAEVQRIYVAPEARRNGLGRRLTLVLIEAARVAGHRIVKLDTGREDSASVGLYRALGFREVPPYHDDTPFLSDQLIYFEKPL